MIETNELHRNPLHLLPGIDDGPSSLEESLELAAAAAREGTGTIVTTPHVHPEFVTDVGVRAERVREVVMALAARRIRIRVRCGGELDLRMVPRLDQWELETIAHGPEHRRWLRLVDAGPNGLLEHGLAVGSDSLAA